MNLEGRPWSKEARDSTRFVSFNKQNDKSKVRLETHQLALRKPGSSTIMRFRKAKFGKMADTIKKELTQTLLTLSPTAQHAFASVQQLNRILSTGSYFFIIILSSFIENQEDYSLPFKFDIITKLSPFLSETGSPIQVSLLLHSFLNHPCLQILLIPV